MQNPSYACVEFADKSVQTLERVVFEQNYKEFQRIDRLIVVNQFALIQTNNFRGIEDRIDRRNNEVIESSIKESDIVLIAWGRNNRYTKRQREVMALIQGFPSKTLLYTSCHPSRARYDGFIQRYNMNSSKGKQL